MAGLSEWGVEQPKGAPELRECGLSRSIVRTFKEHLPGE
jgi:hypothetical protein